MHNIRLACFIWLSIFVTRRNWHYSLYWTYTLTFFHFRCCSFLFPTSVFSFSVRFLKAQVSESVFCASSVKVFSIPTSPEVCSKFVTVARGGVYTTGWFSSGLLSVHFLILVGCTDLVEAPWLPVHSWNYCSTFHRSSLLSYFLPSSLSWQVLRIVWLYLSTLFPLFSKLPKLSKLGMTMDGITCSFSNVDAVSPRSWSQAAEENVQMSFLRIYTLHVSQ